MRIATLFLVSCVLPSHSCLAAFTDFSDYTQYKTFDTGDIFESNGVTFKANDRFSEFADNVLVFASQFAGAILAVGPGVEFLLPDNTQEISFSYINGGGWVISINGVEPSFPTDVYVAPSFLDGMSLAGVAISEISMNTPHLCSECGILTLRGPITSFAIAGVEMSIDDVSVIVPEPATAALLLAASIALLATRRRRYA